MNDKQAWQMEAALLGGLMTAGDAVPEIAEVITDQDFHRPQHAALFRLMLGMSLAKRTIDFQTVLDEVIRGNAADYDGGIGGGGVSYVASLPNKCASVENLPDYAARIREYAHRRTLRLALIAAGSRLKRGDTIPEVLGDLARETAGLGSAAESSYVGMGALAVEAAKQVFEQRPGIMPGIPTGLHKLDEILWGLRPGDLVVIGARPAMGKSAFAGKLAESAGVPVGIVSLEMARAQWVKRLAVARAGVSADAVRKGRLSADDRRALERALEELSELPIYVDDCPDQTWSRIAAGGRRLIRDKRVRMLVVDHLHLVAFDNDRDEDTAGLKKITKAAKGFAKDHLIPVVLLCQLNRDAPKRSDKRPQLPDLRGSGTIEQDADVVMFLHREEYYEPDKPEARGIMEVIVAKQREGSTGVVRVACNMGRMQITDLDGDAPTGGSGYY